MKEPFETVPTPYVRAFEGKIWILLWSSMLLLSVVHTFEAAVLRRQKPTIKAILENFLRVFQSLLQEASKNR